MPRGPLFDTKQEEAIVTFICENESQWNQNHWDTFRRLVACCKFGIEYGKSMINSKKTKLGYGRHVEISN